MDSSETPSTRAWLLGVIFVLLVIITAAAAYVGRLRWQNALLRADLAAAQRKQSTTAPLAPAQRNDATTAPAPAADRVLSADQRQTMLDALRAEQGAQKDVWFTWGPNDPEAAAYQRQLQSVFEEAGWRVRRSAPADFSLRPGIYFLMADDDPPPYVVTAQGALGAAGIELSAGRGYRAFSEQKEKDDPNWRGFDLDADQTYIVAVGRKGTR